MAHWLNSDALSAVFSLSIDLYRASVTVDRTTPLIANIRPAGSDYLMEDFYFAGGLRALMEQLGDKLDREAITCTGKPLEAGIRDAPVYNDDVIRPLSNPVYHEGSLAVLRGNLCPDGAVIKPAACDPKFHRHEGPALVFDSYPEMKAAIDDESLDVTPDHVLVLRNAWPQGGPGFPRMGDAADAQDGAEAGPPLHVADLGCADVGHLLWRLHPACGS